jgi:hypothetical protein
VRNVDLTPRIEKLDLIKQLYGSFDLDVNSGRPNLQWEHRNLANVRLPFLLQSTWFPEFWYRRIPVNRRAADSLLKIMTDLSVLYTPESMARNGLDQFVRCYGFGVGEPNLFWYGAGWELAPTVTGEVLADAIKLFLKHGWTYNGYEERKKLREFEYW